jgi:UDP-N-acetylmuramoyl-L-alanyl-D-glutamate--2,6-diaminopimelate ligase
MANVKQIIKSMISPDILKGIRPLFHGIKAYFFAMINGFPARKLKVIAITGTKGKTSTAVLTGRLMNELGYKTGFASTALLYDGKNEVLNFTKMTSIDAKILQKLLKTMVKNGCKYVVLEMSSQGLEQNRHKGVFGFDIGMFLNLYPEHVEAHGSFEIYRDAKGLLFKNMRKKGTVLIIDKPKFKEHIDYYLNPTNKFFNPKKNLNLVMMNESVYKCIENNSSQFQKLGMYENIYNTNLMADFEIENLAFAIKACEVITNDSNISQSIIKPISKIQTIPGRLEYVVKENHNLLSDYSVTSETSLKVPIFDIMVDYAHETGSMERLLENATQWKKKGFYDYLIHVVSCDGVGRDDWKKPILGEISQKYADFSVVTTDNYEKLDNPNQIIEALCEKFVAENIGKTYATNINRKEAMTFAIKNFIDKQELAGKKVLIVSTGVGAEQQLTQPTGQMQWDERKIWAMLFDEMMGNVCQIQ